MAIRFVDAVPGTAKPDEVDPTAEAPVPAPERSPPRRPLPEPNASGPGLPAATDQVAPEAGRPDAGPKPRARGRTAAAARDAPLPPEPEPPRLGAPAEVAPPLFPDLHEHLRPTKGPPGKPRRNRRGFG